MKTLPEIATEKYDKLMHCPPEKGKAILPQLMLALFNDDSREEDIDI